MSERNPDNARPLWRLVAADEARRAEVVALARLRPEELRQMPNARLVRDVRHCQVIRIAGSDALPALYWKLFRPRSSMEWAKSMFRGSRARRAWGGAEALTRIGLRTPPLVAFGETRGHGLSGMRSFIVTEEIPDSQTVAAYLADPTRFKSADELRRKRALLRQVGEALAVMHNAKTFHADLWMGNILCRRGATGEPEAWLIDTDRVLRHAWRPRHEAARNLVQLNLHYHAGLTLTDRLRIWRAYSGRVRWDAASIGAKARKWLIKRLKRRIRRWESQPARAETVQHMRELLVLIGRVGGSV